MAEAKRQRDDAGDKEKPSKDDILKQKMNELENLEKERTAISNQLTTKEALLAEAKKTREAVESLKDAALTNALANTSGTGEFNTPVQRNALSKEATASIATAVQTIVQIALNKPYAADSCMAFLLRDRSTDKTSPEITKDIEFQCRIIVAKGITDAIDPPPQTSDSGTADLEINSNFSALLTPRLLHPRDSGTADLEINANDMNSEADASIENFSANLNKEIEISDATTSTFGPDTSTERIIKARETTPNLEARIGKWLTNEGIGISTTSFIYGDKYSRERQRAIKDLHIP